MSKHIIPKAEAELSREICLLKEKIAHDGIRVTKMAHQLDNMAKNRLGEKQLSLLDEISDLPISISPSQSSDTSVSDLVSDSMMYYSLNGRAGRLHIENSVIFFDNLIQGLTDLPADIDNTRSKEIRS